MTPLRHPALPASSAKRYFGPHPHRQVSTTYGSFIERVAVWSLNKANTSAAYHTVRRRR